MLEAEQVINERYQLQKKLGRNAGRQTWLAKDLSTDNQQQVVVKLLAFGGDVQWEDLKLFEREAQTLQQLDHSRIPKYQDYFSIDDRTLWFGLVQEYIPGHSLKQLLDKGKRFSEATVKKIAQEILQILIYLHGFNPPLLHRDIKPSNLILGEDNSIYLVDFGAVQDRAATEGATFTVVGTYGYAPMEQFGGKAVPASDLYALGATLIHLLTRTPPGELPTADLKLQFCDRITVSSQFTKWLEKILYPAVEKRFETAQEALDYLTTNHQNFESTWASYGSRNKIIRNHQIFRKPFSSRIKIERYPNLIEITIPPKNNKAYEIFNGISHPITLGVLLVLTPLLFFSYPVIFIIILGIHFYHSKSNFMETRVSLCHHKFQITTNLLGFKQQQQGLTKTIQDISINYVSSSQGTEQLKTDAIIINTKSISKWQSYERFVFGKGLKEEELLWLVSEIRNWLATIS
ncbi:MAG: serine/threonine-protein kinase [Xenococcaceae cyanobacterium MO_167.B27]|nr:serine/threonine-protein kinase [Xenococcaceae cyanobacterium MO_167.B27]